MRQILLCLGVALAVGVPARASVILETGDTVKFLGVVSGASEGNGGAFSWTLTGTSGSTGPSSAIGTDFDTFCTELQQSITKDDSYLVGKVFTPTSGGTINSSGNVLQNMKGVYLFDLWSNNLLGAYNSSWGSAAVAGAVQVALWESEGYSAIQIMNTGGFSLEHARLGHGGHHDPSRRN